MGAEQSQSEKACLQRNYVTFLINGKKHVVDASKRHLGCETRLVDYIRDHAMLKGTKYMCREGGCGVCVVSVQTRDSITGKAVVRAINSCLTPVFSCDGWEITTVEHLGSKKTGYHPFQERMVQFHGSQCGYCTPGWVMNFYSLEETMKAQGRPMSQVDIEECVDGNICRCTGYRPIIDVMRSFAVDAPEKLKRKCVNNDHNVWPIKCPDKSKKMMARTDILDDVNIHTEIFHIPVHLQADSQSRSWVKAVDMRTLFLAILRFQKSGLQYRIVAGNTGTGVYKNEGPYQGFVDINSVQILTQTEASPAGITLGGATTIARTLAELSKAAISSPGFEYCHGICKHWKRMANIFVRNAGTLGGNLMLKHAHREFPSDIFTVLEGVDARIVIASAPTLQRTLTLTEFLKVNMDGKIIYSIQLQPKINVYYRSFKISQRYQNAHAYVNAAFLFLVDSSTLQIRGTPRIVYGGISPDFIHASRTESHLNDKILDGNVLIEALAILDQEIHPANEPGGGSPAFKMNVAQALFYKVMMDIWGERLDPRKKSGIADIERVLTHGQQDYSTLESDWPLYKPVTKVEAPLQCSGEAEYIHDIPYLPEELHGAILRTDRANAILKGVDPSEALKISGIVAWIDYKDIPGTNHCYPPKNQHDFIFVENKIRFAGEAIGVLVGDSREMARKSLPLIQVEYENLPGKPVLTVEDGRTEPFDEDPAPSKDVLTRLGIDDLTIESVFQNLERNPTNRDGETRGKVRGLQKDAAPHNISGEFKTAAQIHFHLENHVSVCVPKEDGIDVYTTTQWMDSTQMAVAFCLGIPCNAVTIHVRRLGGGFGGKISRNNLVAAMCAVAAFTLNKPVRLELDVETNFEMIGKRLPYLFKYNMGFSESGKILNWSLDITADTGTMSNEKTTIGAVLSSQNAYAANQDWECNYKLVYTDTPPNTLVRSPATAKGIGIMEIMMDHMAFTLKKDPMKVRLVNLLQKGDAMFPDKSAKFQDDNLIPQIYEDLKASADLDARTEFVKRFNQENRWKKRGLNVMPIRYGQHYIFTGYRTQLAVFGFDGSVAVIHSGIEMGQGINTKVIQLVARELHVPMEKILVKPTNSTVCPNMGMTGQSVTSECICFSALKACKELKERLDPLRAKLDNPTWEELVLKAKTLGMDLTANGTTGYLDGLSGYNMWSMIATEVEIDCLTGEYRIIRVDIKADSGDSLSPDIDVGQVEGAFMMSVGWLTTENVIYDEENGKLLTNTTWSYKPPMAKDVPEDFRVTLIKNNPNKFGVLRTKGLAEAPFTMGFSVLLALRSAIAAARAEAGDSEWFHIEAPLTVERIQTLCLTNGEKMTF